MSLLRSAAAAFVVAVLAVSSGAAAQPTTDPLRPRQWALDQLHAERAWQKATGKGIMVAVVDTGVDATHPDLTGRVLPGLDLAHRTRNAWDDVEGHGTSVAGVIAAARDNGRGIVGIAPDVRVLPVKVGDTDADGNLLAPAITWAADHGAKVVNVSIGGLPALDAVSAPLYADVQQAIDRAWRRGVLVVVAAGNNAEPVCSIPASLDHALCVGSVDRRQVKPAYSSFDAAMARDYLVAPGGSDSPVGFDLPAGLAPDELVWTTVPRGAGTVTFPDYWAQQRGTSYAAPYVAGVAALLFQRGLTVSQVRTRLLATATDLGTPGRDPLYGYGEVDAARAVG